MRTSERTKLAIRRTISAGLAVAGATALAVLGIQAPAQAAAPLAAAPAATPNGERSCGIPDRGEATCFALRRTDTKPVKGLRRTDDAPTGYGPADLRSAYNLPADGGAGQTVAVVDAYDDPTAEADLAVYRQQYGLQACTTDNGCFTKADQRGGTDYPVPDEGWAGEISLDLDMVSAIAPNAHILLVEADSEDLNDLGTGVDAAVALGAKYVSNSYGTDYVNGPGEDPSEITSLDAHYNHPGVAVVASTGDYGHGVAYPAASPYVTSVGGTSLVRDPGTARGWSETAWDSAGSGCSRYEPKPAFQTDAGCANRAVSDVSADSDLATGVAVYQTYGNDGWALYGGTSAASPIIAGVYADAGTPTPGSYPNSYLYNTSGVGLNDVTAGSNGTCTPAYLCTAGPGYDGPTGLGSPDGLAAFRNGPHGQLSGTVTDGATGKPIASAMVTAGRSVAHTNAQGAYTLPLLVGSYDLAVDAFGYTTGTAKGVAVADGDSLTEDFALARVPSQTVSGKVTDGSGHGYPLYAKITVDGVPGGPVWTDPVTGAYDMTLPKGHDYTLHIASSLPGYEAVTKTVTLGDTPQTANVPIPADSWAATAPGYGVHLTGTTEPFDSADSAPQGWSVVNAAGSKGGWEFGDPGAIGNRTGGDGGFATVDSGHYGFGEHQDSQLISPVYDFTGDTSPYLSFNDDFEFFIGESAEVEVTTDGGATWRNVWSGDFSAFGPVKTEVPLTDYAGKAAVQLRFHFKGSDGWWWSIDNVFIGQRAFTPTPGGLVTGTVTDANTGAGLVGATVSSQDDPAQGAVTVATPDDPGLGDGYYSFFSDPGEHGVTTTKLHYPALSQPVKVKADSTTGAPIKVKVAQLTITPAAVSGSVDWGKQTTQKLKVKNTGSAPATVTLGEQSGGVQSGAGEGAPLQRLKGDFSPLSGKALVRALSSTAGPSTAPSGSAWQAAANLPQKTFDNAVDAYDGKVYSGFGYTGTVDSKNLYAFDPAVGGWTELASAPDIKDAPAHGFINGKFYAVGGWGADAHPDPMLDIYDPATDSWTTGAPAPDPYAAPGTAVLDGKLYMIGGCIFGNCGTTDASAYDPSTDKWSRIAPYPEPTAWSSCAGIDGKLYCAGGDTDNGELRHAYVYDPIADDWAPIADMPIPLWGSAYTTANGMLVASGGISQESITNQGLAYDPRSDTWAALPNADIASYRGGGALGFYKVGGAALPDGATDAVELLPGYSHQEAPDVSWLSESTRQLTLQPGASSTVTVTLDSSAPDVTGPGDYNAKLLFSSDTPYAVPQVPVALHVAPRKTWGTVTGTVYGATAGGGAVPLAGATVRVTGWTASYTLTTDADGRYTLALAAPDNPLTFGVLADGYQPVVTGVKIKKGTTVSKDFILKRK